MKETDNEDIFIYVEPEPDDHKGKKYELTDETIILGTRTLHRIKALKDFSDVKKGDLGGFIESETNLSHMGDCWIYDEAKVYDIATVTDNAQIKDYSVIRAGASVSEFAQITDEALMEDNSSAKGSCYVAGNCHFLGNSKVYGKAYIESSILGGNSQVCGSVRIHKTEITENAIVCGNAIVVHAAFAGNCIVNSMSDFLTFHNWWSSGRTITWTRSDNMWKAGCFRGTAKELVQKAFKDSPVSGREYQRLVDYVDSVKEYL